MPRRLLVTVLFCVASALAGITHPAVADDLLDAEQLLAQEDRETDADTPLPTVSAPTAQLDRYSMRIGDRVTITVAGFTRRGVTATVCGNDGLRGSVDCNLAGAEGIEIEGNGVPDSQTMTIVEPPQPCPCIIRVASSDNSEVAFVDITLVGHPTAPPVTTERRSLEPLAVGVTAEPVDGGGLSRLRSSLGGSLEFEVTVTVSNGSNVDASGVSIAASVGRGLDDVIEVLDLPSPGVIARGQTWTQTVRAELPAPSFGTYLWRVDVSGDRPTVQATDTTSHLPGLLIVAVLVLVADLLYLAFRFIRRRRRRNRAADGAPGSGSGGGSVGGGWTDGGSSGSGPSAHLAPSGSTIDLGTDHEDATERAPQFS